LCEAPTKTNHPSPLPSSPFPSPSPSFLPPPPLSSLFFCPSTKGGKWALCGVNEALLQGQCDPRSPQLDFSLTISWDEIQAMPRWTASLIGSFYTIFWCLSVLHWPATFEIEIAEAGGSIFLSFSQFVCHPEMIFNSSPLTPLSPFLVASFHLSSSTLLAVLFPSRDPPGHPPSRNGPHFLKLEPLFLCSPVLRLPTRPFGSSRAGW